MRKLLSCVSAVALACAIALSIAAPAKAGTVGFADPNVDGQALAFVAALGLSLDPHYLPAWGWGPGYLKCGKDLRYYGVQRSDIPSVPVTCYSFTPHFSFWLIVRKDGQSLDESIAVAVKSLAGAYGQNTTVIKLGPCMSVPPLAGTTRTVQCQASGSWYTHNIFVATVARDGVHYDFMLNDAGKFGPTKSESWERFVGLLRPLAPRVVSMLTEQ